MAHQTETELTFEEIGEADIPEVTRVMTRAFDDDSRRHLGVERGGPEGYDTGEFFRKWLLGCKESVGYKALADGQVVGAMIVWDMPGGENILGTIFVDPDHQDRGVGAQMWQFVERTFPHARSWRLETPRWATKNHFFYEQKCGFARADASELPGSSDDCVVYRKEMRPA